VRAFNRHDREEVNFMTRLCDLHRCRETGEAAADNRNFSVFARNSH
jgi:hypothetical protein